MTYSIVIISKDNRKHLLNCLDKLLTVVPRDIEIVIVEAGNNVADLPFNTKHISVSLKEAGFSNQRNIGVKNASGKYVVFIDDDIEVTETWFENLTRVIHHNDVLAGCMGAVFPKKANILSFCEGVLGHPGGGFRLHYHAKGKIIPLSQVATCNTVLKKSIISDAGWFDLKNKYGSEDTDLCIRITKLFGENGINPFRYIPGAMVWHDSKDNISDMLQWYIRRGKADADLFLKHTVHINYLISTSITLKIMPVIILGITLNWIILPICLIFWCVLQMFRTRFMFKYFNLYNFPVHKRILTFFIFPAVKLLADIMFDCGRLKRICRL